MTCRKRRSDRSGRSALPSPGRPSVARREDHRQFWAAIAAGRSSEDAAVGAGVSPAVGARWFRRAGGMPPSHLAPSAKPLSGRYLSFAERGRGKSCIAPEILRSASARRRRPIGRCRATGRGTSSWGWAARPSAPCVERTRRGSRSCSTCRPWRATVTDRALRTGPRSPGMAPRRCATPSRARSPPYPEQSAHLGLETQRQWSDQAILRTTPALLGLISLVTLWATQLEAAQGLLPECVRWYPKHAPTFSDALALVRRELWTSPTFAGSRDHRDVPKLSANVLSRLLLVACRPP